MIPFNLVTLCITHKTLFGHLSVTIFTRRTTAITFMYEGAINQAQDQFFAMRRQF